MEGRESQPPVEKETEILTAFSYEQAKGMREVLNAIIVSEVGLKLRSDENGEKDAVEKFREKFMDASINSNSSETSVIPIKRSEANEILAHYKRLKDSGKLTEAQALEYTKTLAEFFGRIEGAEKILSQKTQEEKAGGDAFSWASRLASKLSKSKELPYD